MSENHGRGISLGLPGMLTILFVLLKVFNKIDWSWWWVFSPLWITAIAVVLILFIMLVVAVMDKR